MNAVVYVGTPDETGVDLSAVSDAFFRRTNVRAEFTAMKVHPKLLNRRTLLVLDGGMLGT